MKIYVVIPAFNEEKDLEESFSNLTRVFETSNIEAHFHFVNDGSTDKTLELLMEIGKGASNVYISNLPLNMGKGFAVMHGLNNIQQDDCDVYGYVDADLDLDPVNYPAMIKLLTQGNDQIVVGNKLDNRSLVDYPLKRRVLSYIFRKLTKVLLSLDVPDTQTGVKFFTAGVLRDIPPRIKVKSFSFDIEFLAIAVREGYSICSAPIVLKHRFNSSISLRNSMQAVKDLFRIRRMLRNEN